MLTKCVKADGVVYKKCKNLWNRPNWRLNSILLDYRFKQSLFKISFSAESLLCRILRNTLVFRKNSKSSHCEMSARRFEIYVSSISVISKYFYFIFRYKYKHVKQVTIPAIYLIKT